MRILFLLSSLNAGGAERVACTLANAWVAKGYDVVMLPCFSQGNGQSFYSLDERIQVQWLSRLLPANRWLARVMKPFILRRVMREIKADIMVSFLTNVNVMALIAKMGTEMPLIVCERSDPAHQSIRLILKILRKYLYKKANAVLLQTEQAASVFAQSMPLLKRLCVIPNPLPLALEHSDVSVSASGHIVLAVGRLVASKQFDKLIKNFALIAPHCPEWQLHIYGEGPQYDVLQQLIYAQQMQHRIYLKGKTHQPWQVMQQSQILAMSSCLEGFPNVMLEAMACGLPVVCYDCPSGPRELSEGGRVARLVALDDEKAYRSQLLALIQYPMLRAQLAQAGRRSVLARYSQVQVLQQWDNLFDDVLSDSAQ